MSSSFFLNTEILIFYFFFLPEVGIIQPLKFTRDSGCLSRDELLVIGKGDHKLICIFLFFVPFFFWGGGRTVPHCTSWCCKLIRISFGITLLKQLFTEVEVASVGYLISTARLESGDSQKI